MSRFSTIASLLLIATAVVPLALVDVFFYPAVTTKTMFFATVTLLSVALLSVGFARGEAFFWHRLKRKVTWTPALLLVIAYLTSLFGIDFSHSFWGLFDRGAGLLYGLTLPVLAFYSALLVFTKKDGERFLKLVSVVAGLVSLFAFLQWLVNVFNIPIEWLNTEGARIGGTLGNAAYLAAYLGMTVWITFMVRGAEHSKKWKAFFTASLVLQVVAILISATRGTILALFLVLFMLLVWCAFRASGTLQTRARYGVLAVFILAGLFLGFRQQIALIPFEPIQRIATISLSDPTTSNRLFVWGESLKTSLDHLLTGVGAELIINTFNSWYDPSKVTEEWFDRTHNIYIDYLLQYGVFGLAGYILLLGSVAFSVVRGGLLMRERYALLLLLGTYALQNLVLFDTISTFALLFFIFAYTQIRDTDVPTHVSQKSILPFGYVDAVIALLLIIPIAIIPSYANILASTGYKYHVVDVPKANAYFDQSLALRTYIDRELGWQLYTMYTTRQQNLPDPEARLLAYEKAYSVLSDNVERYPYDARTMTYLAHVIDTRPPEASYDREEHVALLSRIIELSPKRSQPWYLTANIFLKEGDASVGEARTEQYRQAMRVLEEYSSLVPGIPTPHFIKANLYLVLGDAEEAEASFLVGEALYREWVVDDARRAVGYLIARGDYLRAEPYLEDLSTEQPTKENLYDLAKIKFLNGNLDGAVLLVNRVYMLDPTHTKSDPNFLSALVNAYNEGGSSVELQIEL